MDYLRDLTWDGVKRLEMLFIDLLGADDTDYTRAVSKKFMISAIARAAQPGCKVDHIIVLEGKQGKHQKSTFIRKLFGDEFFGDNIGDIKAKDTQLLVTRNWCFEIAELDAFSKKDAKEIKAWITRQYEDFRKPWGYNIGRVPRPCVFIASTNEMMYLDDPTGGRRYWPVKCKMFSHKNLDELRDQYWAEAVHYYKNKETWWLSETEEVLASEQQEERQKVDVWENTIELFVECKNFVTTEEVLSECLAINKGDMDKRNQMRVGTILTRLGFKPDRILMNGKRKRVFLRENPLDEGFKF
jgi:putative DNA primase/helicase